MKFRSWNRKSQTATEYILIMTVVIVIALVVVTLIGGFPGIGSGSSKKVSDFKLATGDKVGVGTYYFSPSGNVLAVIKNNNYETLRVENITIAGIICNSGNSLLSGTNTPAFPLTLSPGQSLTINCTDPSFSIVSNTVTPCVSTTYTDSTTSASYSVTLSENNCNANISLGPSYYITYNGTSKDGGSVPTDSNGHVAGASVTVLGQGTLTKSGNTFIGWNTQFDGNGINRAVGTTFSMGSGNVTLYAMWTTNPTYNVVYNGTGADGGSAPIDTNNYVNGMNVTVLGQGTLYKTGYAFSGWNTLANGTGTSRSAGDIFAISSSNITLYSQWIHGDPGSYVCTGSTPGNATLCIGDDVGLLADTPKSLVATCGPSLCEYTCNSEYALSGGVCAPAPVINISNTTLLFQCITGDASIPPQVFTLTNGGNISSILNWTISMGSGLPITCNQTSGNLSGSCSVPISCNVSCNATGPNTTIITITDPTIDNTTIPVTLQVAPVYTGTITFKLRYISHNWGAHPDWSIYPENDYYYNVTVGMSFDPTHPQFWSSDGPRTATVGRLTNGSWDSSHNVQSCCGEPAIDYAGVLINYSNGAPYSIPDSFPYRTAYYSSLPSYENNRTWALVEFGPTVS